MSDCIPCGCRDSLPTKELGIEEWKDEYLKLVIYTSTVSRENAKLRELVRELWEGYMDPPCEDCPLKDKPACADCPICLREAAVIDRMRKLGVEVDA